ncbi:hypothetical protein FRC06_003701 [Ceratobasidium sp. 370]|nr:hypothetical protein FRC06_003701 [Ceratobasidium sp. 370]
MEPLPVEVPSPSPKDGCCNPPTTLQPDAQSQRHVYTTPPTHISRGSRATTDTKERLRDTAPDGARCLITLDREPLECCHVVPVATEHDKVLRLQYAWGFDQAKVNLHLHTVRNLIWLRADMHTRFDHLDWALVPTPNTLNQIMSQTFMFAPGTIPPYFKSRFPDGEWDYHFVLFRHSPVAFLRFSEDMKSDQTYRYPFGGFGPVKSHIHPYFAICNAARNEIYYRENVPDYQSDAPGSPPSRSLEYRESLQKCVRLYEMWTSPIPAPSSGPPPPQPPPPSHHSDRSGGDSHEPERKQPKTERVLGPAHEPRAPQPSGSNNRGSRKRGREESVLTCAHPLLIPELSQRGTFDGGCRVETVTPKVERLVHRWTSVSSWVEDVKASEPLEDPHNAHTKLVDRCLTKYRGEVARRLPWGPWEEWVPEYVLTD